MRFPDRTGTTAKERFEKAFERMHSHLNRGFLNSDQKRHLETWTMETAHAVFEMHPELREDGSLLRYFVAKEGRKQGLRGEKLTAFVEDQYHRGTWWRLVPEAVLKGEPNISTGK